MGGVCKVKEEKLKYAVDKINYYISGEKTLRIEN